MPEGKPIRLIDDLGRIVLPIEVRQAMDWGDKTPVEIWLNATDNEVVIKRHEFTCTFCGEPGDLKRLNKKHICPSCQEEISKL